MYIENRHSKFNIYNTIFLPLSSFNESFDVIKDLLLSKQNYCPLLVSLPKKISTVFFLFLTRIKTKNSMKNIEIHIFFLVKNKKPVEIFFGRITNYWTLLFEISTFFLDMRRFQMYHIYI